MRDGGMRRHLLVMVAAGLALGPAAARAQGYDHGPVSSGASHTPGSSPGSVIAPRLPEPAGDVADTPEHFLREADRALSMRKTGLAQQSLEMAETRMLDRSTLAEQARTPDASPEIAALHRAREALGRRDTREARLAVAEALRDAPPGGSPPIGAMPGGPPDAGVPPAPPPGAPGMAPPAGS